MKNYTSARYTVSKHSKDSISCKKKTMKPIEKRQMSSEN